RCPNVVVPMPVVISRVAAYLFAGEYKDARVQFAHDADQPPHLVPGGEATRDGAPSGGLVARRARCREADGAGADGVAQLAFHPPEVVLAVRLLEGPLAPDVGAHRRVTDVARVVE